MKENRLIVILLCLAFILSGCSTQNTDSTQKVDTSVAPWAADDGAKEITVAVIDTRNFYNDAAKEFENETGVKVNIINYQNKQDPKIMRDSVKKAEAELMSGKGADIYALKDYLDYKSYGREKRFCDLKDWISQDDYFKGKFYENILTSGMDDGKIYAIPLQFTIEMLQSEIEIPEIRKLKNPNWEQFMNTGKDLKRNGKLLNMYDFEIFENRVRARKHDIIDVQNKTQKLDSKEMVDLLKQCKEWGDSNLCSSSSTIKNGIIDYGSDGLLNWFGITSSEIRFLCNITPGTFLYDMPSDFNKNQLESNVIVFDFIAVNEASKNKATAMKFIKFLLGEKMQSSSDLLDIAVNRIALEKQIDRCFHSINLTDDYEKKKKEVVEVFNSIGEVSAKSVYIPIISKEANRYFRNEITAEQAAKEMAQKVELMLKEQ